MGIGYPPGIFFPSCFCFARAVPTDAEKIAHNSVASRTKRPTSFDTISFPASNAQLAHAEIPGFKQPHDSAVHITYDEGAAIGYKWYDAKGFKPLFAFGHGLSYTSFAAADPKASVANGSGAVKQQPKQGPARALSGAAGWPPRRW